jgi:hypothetical protein
MRQFRWRVLRFPVFSSPITSTIQAPKIAEFRSDQITKEKFERLDVRGR